MPAAFATSWRDDESAMPEGFLPGRRPVDNVLRERLALVTGASGPLGRAIALALAREGMHIACHYHRDQAGVEETLRQLRSQSPWQRFTIHQSDLSDLDDNEQAGTRALIHSLGSGWNRFPDVLICNHGASRRAREIEEVTLDDFDHDWALNTRAPFVLTKAVVPAMRARQFGRIVYVSSIAAHGGGLNGPHYASSKGGLTSIAKNLATTLIKDGITVNVVSPAFICGTAMIPRPLPPTAAEANAANAVNAADSTASSDALLAAQQSRGDPGLAIARTVPAGRLGECSEVADVIAMFCRVGYMTGQDVLLTGGLK